MRPSRAAVHLQGVADAATRSGELVALLLVGELLEGPDDVTFSQVVGVLDRPARRLTWGSTPLEALTWVREERLDNLPLQWWWRSAERPADNHVLYRPLAFWTSETGTDEVALAAVASADVPALESLRPDAPEVADLVTRLRAERDDAAQALTDVVDTYWERGWRRNQQRLGRYPEHRLWDLAWGLADLEQALPRLADES